MSSEFRVACDAVAHLGREGEAKRWVARIRPAPVQDTPPSPADLGNVFVGGELEAQPYPPGIFGEYADPSSFILATMVAPGKWYLELRIGEARECLMPWEYTPVIAELNHQVERYSST